MIKSIKPSITKSRCVCIYYKKHLPVVRRPDISCLGECIEGEMLCNMCVSFPKSNDRCK